MCIHSSDRLFLEKINSADAMKNLKVEKNKSRNTQLHFATKIIEIHPETKEYDQLKFVGFWTLSTTNTKMAEHVQVRLR